ncbi:MAG TPA: hypothetical protein VGI89_02700 [Rhizomicrobium sp.]|jgi:hypothetical protein
MTFRIALPAAFLCILPFAALADDIAPMALNSIGAVPPKIQGAPVEDIHGAIVGRVARIETDVQGKPLRADVTLNGGRMVFLDTVNLSYDESTNVLVTALDQQQLAQLADQRRG